MTKDYYKILGVKKTATADEIKKAYRKKMKEIHPDLHPNDKTLEEKTKEINEAYEILGNDEKRRQYDLGMSESYTSTQTNQTGNMHSFMNEVFNDLYEDIFTGFGPSPAQQREKQLEEYDKFMVFLTEIDAKCKEFGFSSKKYRESLKGKRGLLTLGEIYNFKNSIERQLNELQEKARHYDNFIYEYNEKKAKIVNLGGTLNEENFQKYLDRKNRGIKDRKFYEEAINKLREIIYSLDEKRNKRFNELLQNLKNRGLTRYIFNYMSKHGMSNSTNLTQTDFDNIATFIDLFDQVNDNLASRKIKLEDILGKIKKDRSNLTLAELKIINKNVLEMNKGDILAKWKLNNTILAEINLESSHKL